MRFFVWIKREVLHVFPIFLFFLISFTLINLIERMLLERAGIAPFTLLQIFLAAAVIAKVILVIDHLPLISFFPNKPLIGPIFWKSLLYWTILLAVRAAIRFAPFLMESERLSYEWNDYIQKTDWGLFYTIQGYYLFLFFIYVTLRELTLAIGPLKMRKLLFGF